MNYVTFETSIKLAIGPCSSKQEAEIRSLLDEQSIDCSIVKSEPATGKKIDADWYILQNILVRTKKITMKEIAELVNSDHRNRSVCVKRRSVSFKAYVAMMHSVRVSLNSSNEIVEQYRGGSRIFKSLEAYRSFLLRKPEHSR